MKFRHKFGLFVAFSWLFLLCFQILLPTAFGDISKPFKLYFNYFHEFYPELIVSFAGLVCLTDYLITLRKGGEL